MATHFASPHHSRAPHKISGNMPMMPKEDIGSVIERFHNWAGKHAEPIRELTYEEAVKRSRRRVYAEEESAQPIPINAAPEVSSQPQPAADPKPSASRGRKAKSAPTSNGKTKKKAGTAQSGSTGKPKTARRTTRKTAAQPSRKTSAAAARNVADDATAEAAPAPREPEEQTVRTAQQAPATITPPATAPDPNPGRTPSPSFEQVLAAQLRPPAVQFTRGANTPAIAPLPADAPTVHLTARFAPEERNAIRERAKDLGVTPADYLRHCALEVDSLRHEMEESRLACTTASSAIMLTANTTDSVEIDSDTPNHQRRRAPRNYPADGSWLARLIRKILPGKTKGQVFSTSA